VKLECLGELEYIQGMARPLVWQLGTLNPPCYRKNVKQQASSNWSWAISVLLIPLLTGCFSHTTTVTEENPSPEVQTASLETEAAADPDASPAETEPATDVLAPAFKLVSSEITVPASARLSDPGAEVVKLANAGLDESVMLAFITNSPYVFDLGPEEIIYLTDIGVGAEIIKAMLVHDHNNPGVAFSLISAAEPVASLPPTMLPLAEAVPEPGTWYPAPPAQFESVNYSQGPPVEAVGGPDPDFYEALAPYGNWVDVEGYGSCWQPTVAVSNSGWKPYLDRGRWVYSDCGWYWSSGYSWGWAPFHYGRWFEHPTLHWCWVPEKVWGPSWVCWRYNDNYCGWSPLPPAAKFTTAGLFFKGRPASADCQFGLTASTFQFVPAGRIRDSHLAQCVLRRGEADRVFAQTTVSTGIRRHHESIVNTGLPANRAGGTTTPIVALRPRHVETLHGNRERFEANGSALAIPLSAALVPASPAQSSQARAGETRHATASADLNLSPRENAGNTLPPHTVLSQPGRPVNPNALPLVQPNHSAGMPVSIGTPMTPIAPNQLPPRSSLVVIGHKGASSNPSHGSPYVYYASVLPQPQQASIPVPSPAAPVARTIPDQRVPHTQVNTDQPIRSQAQWWIPTQPSGQPVSPELPRHHDRTEGFNASYVPSSYPPTAQHAEAPHQQPAPAHQPQNDPPPVSRHEQATPAPQHSDPAPQSPQPHSHESSSSSSTQDSASHSSSSSSGHR
jgi:hypothetical protein